MSLGTATLPPRRKTHTHRPLRSAHGRPSAATRDTPTTNRQPDLAAPGRAELAGAPRNPPGERESLPHVMPEPISRKHFTPRRHRPCQKEDTALALTPVRALVPSSPPQAFALWLCCFHSHLLGYKGILSLLLFLSRTFISEHRNSFTVGQANPGKILVAL